MTDLTVLLASDSFKGSASSAEIAELLEQGVRRVVPECVTKAYAIADGGEGTVAAVVTACGGEYRTARVIGPLGDEVFARYGLIGDAAVIEVAQSSGITLIEQNHGNALRASSYGVGQLILDALDCNVKRIYVGLGGSATSDGGAGMAQALGVRLLNEQGNPISRGLLGLDELFRIDCSGIDSRITDVEIVALTDVCNPLVGAEGAVSVYGPQKGIERDQVMMLDGWMKRYASLITESTGRDVSGLPGAGAAGGLGAALVAFCGARITSGIDTLLDLIGLEQALDDVDLVITGEGRMDAQSVQGKAPIGVAKLAKRHGKPVIAVVGSRADDLGDVYAKGIDVVVSAVTQPATLDECLQRVRVSVPIAAETAVRAFLLGRSQ
ncbi:glycerate kinase [Bifidobacterium oedipodis]|uniref:Glycerate kinase n=1 Tax=Bifidobacterium oedipodis TaxID=2675322 RepID=A0A7Y0HTC0_9BIFI|nr:glycerate kinase [Bifidobacterium sp. DSM 109957]NMM94443.1 glycerate kinase [Bifidobacterium sp. DSM 109957]